MQIRLKQSLVGIVAILLVGCGAKDNLVDGITPQGTSGSRLSLSGGPNIASNSGDSLVANYSLLMAQKLVETAKLVPFIEQAANEQLQDSCTHLRVDELGNQQKQLTFAYYSNFGTGQCSDTFKLGKNKFLTTLDGISEESFRVKSDASGDILSIDSLQQNVGFSLGIVKAPKRYVDGSGHIKRSLTVKRLAAAECSGYQRCYSVISRLLLDVDQITFSPAKNAEIKFKERDSRYDFRLAFTLKIAADQLAIQLSPKANYLFVQGERMPFKKDFGNLYNGKLVLKDSDQEFIINQMPRSCGYFSQGQLQFFFKWGYHAAPLRSMERVLDAKIDFSTTEVSATILKNRKEQIFSLRLSSKNCSDINHSYLGPYLNLYSLFAY